MNCISKYTLFVDEEVMGKCVIESRMKLGLYRNFKWIWLERSWILLRSVEEINGFFDYQKHEEKSAMNNENGEEVFFDADRV